MFRSISLLLTVVVLASSLMLASSCATLLAKDERTIMITSNPPGAEITVNGQRQGVTPTRISVDDHNRLAVTIRKPGFHPGGCYINTSIGAVWVILDLVLFATVVPLVVDLVTGEWSSLDSKYCSVNLLPMN